MDICNVDELLGIANGLVRGVLIPDPGSSFTLGWAAVILLCPGFFLRLDHLLEDSRWGSSCGETWCYSTFGLDDGRCFSLNYKRLFSLCAKQSFKQTGSNGTTWIAMVMTPKHRRR
jgi:hypothetical protein